MKYDKQYNEEFYGVPTDFEWLKWYREDETEPFALRVPQNDYGYLWSQSPFRPTHWAQPLDTSISLWSIRGDSCFASVRTTLVTSSQSTLRISITENDNPDTVPFTIDARSNETFTSFFNFRLAYDITYENLQFNPDSYMLYDISYKDVVISPDFTFYDYNNNQYQNFNNMTSALTWLQSHIPAGDNFALGYLTTQLLAGTDVTTNNREMSIEAVGDRPEQYLGRRYMVPDILSEIKVPDDENFKQSLHQMWSWDTPDPTYRDDAVWFPFYFAYGNRLFDMQKYDPDIKRLYAGYSTEFTHQHIVTGYTHYSYDATIPISGFTSRMSTTRRNFEDVAYHWEDAIYNTYTQEFVEDGYEMTGEPTSATYKFISKIVIDDAKNHSIPESIMNAIKHEYAFLGFYFGDSNVIAETKATGSETDGIGWYLPNRTFNIPDGTYVTGADIADSPFADMDTTEGLSPLDPDDETYKDKTPALNNQSLTIEGVHMYSLVNLPGLIANINSIPVRDQDSDLYTDRLFFGADPYEYILGYGLVPLFFVPQAYIDEGELDYITLGKYQSTAAFGASEIKAINRTLKIPLRRMLIQPTKIPYEFNNFLDFEPYTTLSLYLPFAGTIDLPPSIFVGHSISVYSSLDLLAGTVTYIIYADNIQYTTVTCNVRVEMPIHGADISAYSELMVRTAAEKRSALFNMNANIGATLGRAGASFGISAVSGNVIAGIASSIGGAMSLSGYFGDVVNQMQLYNTVLTRTSPTPISISSGSMPDGFANTLTPYISRTVPRYASGFKTEVYGKLNGFACYINDVISNYHGFTVIENPILDDLPISAKEKEMLRKALSQGVILP
ncbi:MAG: hypothetical protein J6R32_10820 [Bacteroidales bacterium]|nr:hypothetical protein [Bacteroidales bacterium]